MLFVLIATVVAADAVRDSSLVWNPEIARISAPLEDINYPGGWILPEKRQCVDICVKASPFPTCFVNTTDCIHKKQQPGDYNNLVFEQLYLPQYCRDLLLGIDSTVSHRPVAPYPRGIRCIPPVRSRLTIHGLWPNYIDGFPACCNATSAIRNRPFDPFDLVAKTPDLFHHLAAEWPDPTQVVSTDSLCELWNHEFQKHGLCFSVLPHDFTATAVQYFEAALTISRQLAMATDQLEQWATATLVDKVSTEEIARLYNNLAFSLLAFEHAGAKTVDKSIVLLEDLVLETPPR
ncbi:unnamed protein product [Aphanomyces euteiches]